jgi:hypothetical protein
MTEEKNQELHMEALMHTLVEKTWELLALIYSKANPKDISCKRKEIEQLQKAIAQENPTIKLR